MNTYLKKKSNKDRAIVFIVFDFKIYFVAVLQAFEKKVYYYNVLKYSLQAWTRAFTLKLYVSFCLCFSTCLQRIKDKAKQTAFKSEKVSIAFFIIFFCGKKHFENTCSCNKRIFLFSLLKKTVRKSNSNIVVNRFWPLEYTIVLFETFFV